MEKELKYILFSAPGREFVKPYVERELPDCVLVADASELPDGAKAELAVMLSGCEVYDADEGENLDESTPLREDSALARAEKEFTAEAAHTGLPAMILRCANTVGTGMTGFPMSIARSIYRGFYFHFKDNDARLSCVHASQVAAALRLLIEKGTPEGGTLTVNITDGSDTTLHDFAEAIVARMGNKRISTLSTWGQIWLGKLFYGKERYRRLTSTLTYSDARLRELIGPARESMVEYMRNHVYDEDSL